MNPSPAPMTLGSAAAAHLRLIIWCQEYCHRVEPDPAEMAERLRAETTVPDWAARLVRGQWGGQPPSQSMADSLDARAMRVRGMRTGIIVEVSAADRAADGRRRESGQRL